MSDETSPVKTQFELSKGSAEKGSTGSGIEVVGAIGLAESILTKPDSLKDQNFWMFMSTSKKTYPDELVVDFAKWAEQHGSRFMLVIADGMQVYNQLVQKGIDPYNMTDQQKKWYKEEQEEYRREASKRRKDLSGRLEEDGLKKTEILLWSELYEKLKGNYWQGEFTVDAFEKMAYTSGTDEIFDKQIDEIVEGKIGYILNKSKDREQDKFVAGLYPREQWDMAMSLISQDVNHAKYTIKVGPEGERVFDEQVLDTLKHGFGTLRIGENDRVPFGAVYLKRTELGK